MLMGKVYQRGGNKDAVEGDELLEQQHREAGRDLAPEVKS